MVALSVDETRKLSASLSAMINEKQKAAKSGNKKKTSKKPSSTVSSSRGLDMTNYDGNVQLT